MKEIRQEYLTGERALFQGNNLKIYDTIFADGESPLKESHDIELFGSMFQWKYPLWYSKNILAENCTWLEMARAGVWYTDNITVKNAVIEAPKNFRRCHGLVLQKVDLPNAAETLWNCEGVVMEQVTLVGNYSFDGVKNAEIHNAKMLSKDAFWNSENVTVYDSFISGEYLGWNAKNLTLINCTIESLQGMCYIENLVMKNCRLIHTALALNIPQWTRKSREK